MNQIKQETLDQLETMFRDSFTIRQVAKGLGLSKCTVTKYQRQLNLHTLHCACGKGINHRGWCKVRYQRSPSRMKYWESRFNDEPIKTPKRYDDQAGYFGT